MADMLFSSNFIRFPSLTRANFVMAKRTGSKSISMAKPPKKVKETPTKQPNRFRFQTFSERIDSISIDSFTRLTGFHGARPAATSSWLLDALEAWRDLDYTAAFTALLARMSPLAVSLPAVLFNKDEIIKALLEGVSMGRKGSTGVLKPACNLLAMVVKDLGEEETFPYFTAIFKSVAKALVEASEPEDIEAAFSCLVYALKAMKGKVLQNIGTVYTDLFVPLFRQSKREHLQRLACFCYSYLIRQSGEGLSAVDAMLQTIESVDCVTESIILSIVEPESGRPRDQFRKCVIQCLEQSSNIKFHDALVLKIVERISIMESLVQIVSQLHTRLSDDGLTRILLACKSADLFISALESRLVSSTAMTCAVLVKLNLEKTLGNRVALVNILTNMSEDDLSTLIAVLGELKWPHSQLLLPPVLSSRQLGEKLRGVLACYELISPKTHIDPETCFRCLNMGMELQVALMAYKLKKGHSVDSVLTFLHHPAIFCNVNDLVGHFDQLLLWLASSHIQASQKALHLLASQLQESKLVQLLVKIDSIPATLEQYRSRIMALKQLELVAIDSQEEIRAAICFLLGTLHIKLTLLWPETFRNLSVFATRHPNIFGDCIGRLFDYATDSQRDIEMYSLPPQITSRDVLEVCSEMGKRLQSMESLQLHFARMALQADKFSILDSDSIPVWLKMTVSCSSLAQICQPQLHRLLLVISGKGVATSSVLKAAQSNLALIIQSLALVGRFDPAFLSMVEQCAMKLLANGDPKIQHHALVLTLAVYKAQIQPEFAADLKALLDEKTGRDQLITISNEIGKWASNRDWKSHLLPVLTRALYGKMISRRKSGGAGRNSMEQRRRTILQALAGWPNDAIECFVHFVADPSPGFAHTAGFLSMLEPVFAHMGRSLSQSSFTRLLSAILDTMECDLGDDEKRQRRLRNVACQRLILVLQKADGKEVDRLILDRVWALAIKPRLDRFEHELVQARSATVSLLAFLADSDYVELVDGEAMSKVTAAISSEHIKAAVLKDLLMVPLGIIKRNRIGVINLKELIDAVSVKTLQSIASKDIFGSGVRILQGLAREIQEPGDAKRLLEMAIDILCTSKLHELQRCELIVLIGRLYACAASVCNEELVVKIVSGLSLQLSMLEERGSRQAVVEVFAQFTDDTPAWHSSTTSQIIGDLEAWSVESLDEADYDRRTAAMGCLRRAEKLDTLHWVPILQILLHYLQDPEEIALRNQAAGLIERYIQQSADISLCETVIFPAIKRCATHKNESVRFEFFALLGKLVEQFGDTLDKYKALWALLAGGTEESNVFTCFGHLQVHRRARALRQIVEFTEKTGSTINDASIFVEVLLPMLFKYCLYNADAGDPIPAPLVNMEAVRTVGWLCGRFLDWPAYFGKIRMLIRQTTAPKYPGVEKQAVKLLPELLARFDADRMEVDVDTLKDKVLPLLFAGMWGSAVSGTTITHIPIAVAIAQLLRRLPQQVIQVSLPKLYSALAQTLKSRSEDERRDARETIVKVVQLFPDTLLAVLGECKSVLSRGYQRHVLAYTLYPLLGGVKEFADEAIVNAAMDIIVDDTMGEIAEEKGTEEWSGKLKEARDCKSFASLGLLVKTSTDCRLLMVILSRLAGKSVKLDRKQAKIMGKLLDTILSNLSGFSSKDLLILAHELVNIAGKFYSDQPDSLLFHHLGIKIASSVVKRDERSPELTQYLELIARLVVSHHWMGCRDNMVIVGSIKLVCHLLMQHPSLPILNDIAVLVKLLQSAFELIVRSSATTHADLIAAAFKYVAIMVRDHADVEITDGQIRALLQYTSANLERMDSQQLTFSLIRSILSRRVHSADLYQLMARVRELAVTAGSPATRQHCLQCFHKFYSEYPMSDRRRVEHVDFFVANLSYSGEGGRLSAVLGLEGCFGDLAIGEELGERLVKTLTLAIANEESEKVKGELERGAVAVVRKLSGKCIDSCMQMAVRWLGSGRLSVKRCAWTCLSILFDAPNKTQLLTPCIESITELDTSDCSDDNSQLIASILGVVARVQLDDYQVFIGLMLYPNLVIRKLVDEVLLGAKVFTDDTSLNAYKQITELTDVHGSVLADLAVQLMLGGSGMDMCGGMERLVKRAGSSQFTAHIGSAFKYFGGLITLGRKVDPATVIRTSLRVTTNQSLVYPDALKELAQQVLELLHRQLGEEQYESLAAQIMAARSVARTERRVARKQLAVTNPGASARSKIARNRK